MMNKTFEKIEVDSILDSINEIEKSHLDAARKYSNLRAKILLFYNDRFNDGETKPMKLTDQAYFDHVQKLVLRFLNYDFSITKDYTRKKEAAKYRQTMCYILLEKTNWAQEYIGHMIAPDRERQFDHATVIHARKLINGDLAIYEKSGVDVNGTHRLISSLLEVIDSFEELAYKLRLSEEYERDNISEEVVEGPARDSDEND